MEGIETGEKCNIHEIGVIKKKKIQQTMHSHKMEGEGAEEGEKN